jgi:hypothetical protein
LGGLVSEISYYLVRVAAGFWVVVNVAEPYSFGRRIILP